jgi:hypothetical protein
MRVVTSEEMREFLARSGLRCAGRELHFDCPDAKSVRVDFLALDPHQLAYLARLVAHLRYEELDFVGASLWLTNLRIGNDRVGAIGFKAIERMRQGHGENRSIETSPGHFFRHDEFVESVALLLQPMLVGWEAYYVPQWAWGTLDYFVFVNDDSYFRIETRTTEMHEKAIEILQSHDWLKTKVKDCSAGG